AFKLRGALNAMLRQQEQGTLPEHVVTFSSGNHAQAVAYACRLLGAKATIVLPEYASKVKQQACRDYSANILLVPTRQEAEAKVAEMAGEGAFFLPPYDHDDIIAGQGTACYEALKTGLKPDAIFATCGGGGWVSGTYLAAQLLCPSAKIYAG